MARYYVKKDGRWNVFSSIVDDFLYTYFMEFDELKALVVGEVVLNKLNELETLQTERPRLNTMSYEDAMEIIREVHANEIEDTTRSDCCTCKHSKEKAETAYPYCRLCGYNNESNYIPQTGQYDYNKSEMENIKLGNGISREIPTPDCP